MNNSRSRFIFTASLTLLLTVNGGMILLSEGSSSSKDKMEEDSFVYDDQEKRDPFWPLVSSSGVIVNYEKDLLISDMIVEGIMVDNKETSVAIINGIIVKIDDKIGLYTIKKIDPRSVVLQKGPRTFVLKLKEE